jgi:Ni,Fe-hydrogenase III small subunit/NAD-dependent dihydropyrimidine dehydrogenase PreA subunit
MLESIRSRARTGKITVALPAGDLPAPFRGMPVIGEAFRTGGVAAACAAACATGAIDPEEKTVDLGRCVFCGLCEEACGSEGIRFSRDPRLPWGKREHLVLGGPKPGDTTASPALRSLLGRSLHLREVSAGGCNGCDLEAQAFGNPIFDLQRFGIDFVASPRHADGLLITGPVSKNMREALLKTYEAVAEPRIVIAIGACAASGGIFRDSYAVENGVGGVLPVDLFIPGCPPHPLTLLHAILGFLGKEPHTKRRRRGAGDQR